MAQIERKAIDENRDLMLLSSSFVIDNKHYLGYCAKELQNFLRGCRSVLFLPFAYSNYDEYTAKPRHALAEFGLSVTGAHLLKTNDASALVQNYDVIFCGGGNTFLLLKTLYERGLLPTIQEAVARGVKYMGASAGANIVCPTIGTTNDMPIVAPPSLVALDLIPFNINPHYYVRPKSFKHRGETRRERIIEFIQHNKRAVIALPEGSMLRISGKTATLLGSRDAVLFRWNCDKLVTDEVPVVPGSSLDELLL